MRTSGTTNPPPVDPAPDPAGFARPRTKHNFIGAVGLLLLAILGPIGLLVVWTEPATGFVLFVGALVGFVLWTFSLATAAGMGYRLAVAWMGFWVGSLTLGAVIVAVSGASSAAVGVEPRSGAGLFAGWARRDPQRAATMQALRRAAMSRASDDDCRRLAGGPRALLRGGTR